MIRKTIQNVVYDLRYDFQLRRGGFKHIAQLKRNGVEVCTAEQLWCNRTWEGYPGQYAMRRAVRSEMNRIADEVKALYKETTGARRVMKAKLSELLGAEPEYQRLNELAAAL